MKVVFLESVEGTAQVGETKDVKNGFARNYLLPRGLAAPAIEPYLRRAQSRAAREEKRQQELDRDAGAVAERLEGSRIEIVARVGEQGKLYGSVTSVHVAAEVAKLIGDEEFDHRKVLLPEAIKEVGVQPIRLRLTRNVEAAIELEVVAEVDEEEAIAEGEAGAVSEEAEASVDEHPEAVAEEAEAVAEEQPEAVAEEAEAVAEEQPEAVAEEADVSAEEQPEAVAEKADVSAEEQPEAVAEKADVSAEEQPEAVAEKADVSAEEQPEAVAEEAEAVAEETADAEEAEPKES